MGKAPTPKQVDAALNFYAAAKHTQGNQSMTGTPPKLPSMFEMMLSASASAAAAKAELEHQPWPVNPFPSGIRPGSATEKIRAILTAEPLRWFEHHQLMRLTGHSRGAVTWGLRYLQEHELVRSIPSARQSQYRRYRITEKGLKNGQ